MSNSYVDDSIGLYRSIFTDISVALPSVNGLERDVNRLLSCVQSRGFRYLTIDLPAYGKHFDRCLSEGRLVPSHIPSFGWVKKGTLVHPFLGGLMLRVFDRDGSLLSQPCISSIIFLRQLFYAVKKVELECTERVRENALRRYIDQERSVRSPSLNWLGDQLDHHGGDRLSIDDVRFRDGGYCKDLFEDTLLDSAFCDTVHSVADRLVSAFGSFDPMAWRGRHGPGAVADGQAKDFKYDFPTWSSRLEAVFPYADLAFANHALWVDTALHGTLASTAEVPSVVLTVPKSQKTPRIISKESTATMWCQQIIRDFLEEQVRLSPLAASIHFKDQSFNGRAALLASRSGSHWTIDLSDASDRMSVWLIERLFRANKSLLDALHSSRSPYSVVGLRQGSVLLNLKKFAPQGAATTFPVQTIVYAILAISSVIYARKQQVTARTIERASKEVLVFGDDSIVPEDCGRQYLRLLEYCGFTVNYSKTYGTGKFRESCGVEAYNGTDVTPAYFTKPYEESDPSSIVSVVACSNNFFSKLMWHTAAFMESTLPSYVRKNLRVVKLTQDGDIGDGRFGLSSYVGPAPTGKTRWNPATHNEECRALSLSAKVTRIQPGGPGHLLQYFTEEPAKDIRNWMSGTDGRREFNVRIRWEPVAI